MTQQHEYQQAGLLGAILEGAHHTKVNTQDFFGYFRHMKVDGGEPGEGRKQGKKGGKDQGRLLGKSKTLMESMQNGLLKMFLKNKQRRMQKI